MTTTAQLEARIAELEDFRTKMLDFFAAIGDASDDTLIRAAAGPSWPERRSGIGVTSISPAPNVVAFAPRKGRAS